MTTRVLVVDDDAAILELIRQILEPAGFAVLTAANANEAWAQLEFEPDVALIDVQLPGETGPQFLLRLRKHPSLGDLPAAFVTGFPERANSVQVSGFVSREMVTKPFRPQAILDAVKALARSRRRRVDFRVRVSRDAVHARTGGASHHVVKNLSVGGLFLATRQRWHVGEQVQLELEYKQDRAEGVGRATHCQSDGIGFAFMRPSRELLVFVRTAIEDLMSDGSAVSDQRLAVRVPVRAAIVVSNGDERTAARLRDLSTSGAFVVSDRKPEIGEKTIVYLPGYAFSKGSSRQSELRGCVAEVVRHGGDGFGCRFCEPSAEFQMAIGELVRGRTADGDEPTNPMAIV